MSRETLNLQTALAAHDPVARRSLQRLFAMVQVYVEPIARRHYAPLFSQAGLYRPLCVGTSQTPLSHTARLSV